MATLPVIRPDGDGTIATSVITRSSGTNAYYTYINQDPTTGQPDSGYLYNAGAAGGDSHFTLQNMPLDFNRMSTLTVRTYSAAVGRVDDNVELRIGIFDSTETVRYAGDSTGTQGALVSGAANPNGLYTTNLTLTTAGQNATQADWNNARVRVNWIYSQSMSKDAYDLRLHALELNGTYTQLVATTKTKTYSVDATIYRKVVKNHSVDTYLLRFVSKSHTVDASIISRSNAVLTIARYDRVNQSSLIDMHAGQGNASSTTVATPNASISLAFTRVLNFYTANGPATTITPTSEQATRGQGTSGTVKALLTDEQNIFPGTTSNTATLDAADESVGQILAIRVEGSTLTNYALHLVDAALMHVSSVAHSIDTLLSEAIEVQHNADASIAIRLVRDHAVDAVFVTAVSQTHDVDSVLRDSFTQEYMVDAIIQVETDGSHTVDAVLRSTRNRTHLVDAALQLISDISYSIDVLVKLTAINQHIVDAALRGISSSTHLVDALINKAGEVSHSVDSALRGKVTVFYISDAILAGRLEGTYAVDALLKANQTVSQDAFINGHLVESDTKNTFTYGHDLILDTQPAHINVATDIISSQTAFIRGYDSIIDNEPAFVYGHGIETSMVGAYVHDNALQIISSKIAYIHGDRHVISQSKLCYMNGASLGMVGILVRDYPLYINGGLSPRMTSLKRVYIVNYSIIGDWDFDDAMSNPFSAIFDDSSDTNNDGILFNNPTWIPGPHCGDDA